MFKYLSNRSSSTLEDRIVGKWALGSDESDGWTVRLDGLFSPSLLEFESGQLSESPLVWNDDFLSSWEFVLGSSEGFQSCLDVLLVESDGVQNGSNCDSGNLSVRFTEGLSHTSLKSISTSAWQHLIDSDYVPWVNSASQMEVVLSNVFG